MSDTVKPMYLNQREKDGQTWFSKNLNTTEGEPNNYISANILANGDLSVSVGDEKVVASSRNGQYGPYYIINIMDKTYFASEGISKFGKFVKLKEAAPREEVVGEVADNTPPARETFGARG